jgi:hypothetical protein
MALKRLDEEFELKPGTQLLPYMKRLLPSLEARFQDLEEVDRMLTSIGEDIRAAALLRMNDILIPATEDIIAVTKLGFLLAPVTQPLYAMKIGYIAVYVDEGPQRDTFTPSPYLIVEGIDDKNNYCIAKLISYDQDTGLLEMDVTAIHGDPSGQPWMVTSTPGMAHSTKDYHDAIAPMHDDTVIKYDEIILLHAEIMAAAQALAESGLDAYAFIRRDGVVPFEALQIGVAPDAFANDAYITTSAWVRSRIIEYTDPLVRKSGSTMTGPLYLNGYPTQPTQAATKDYVDSAFGTGGTMRGHLTIHADNPSIYMRQTNPGQQSLLWMQAYDGTNRWVTLMDTGENYGIYRYGDGGTWGGVALSINRANGAVAISGPLSSGYLNVAGGGNIDGDLHVYRGASNTGVVYLNQANNAYHYYDGSTHVFAGGGGAFHGGLNTHHVSCYSVNTQGHYLTTWGMTSHGQIDCNGQMIIRGDLVIEGGGANYIRFWDNTYGNSYIHHNDGLIGFLQHDAGWLMYTNNAGQMWTRNYGWVHDYINQQANWYAWDAANYRYNQLVATIRFHHLGDVQHYFNQLQEPWGGAVITGITGCYSGYYVIGRYRQCHMLIAGGWHAAGY